MHQPRTPPSWGRGSVADEAQSLSTRIKLGQQHNSYKNKTLDRPAESLRSAGGSLSPLGASPPSSPPLPLSLPALLPLSPFRSAAPFHLSLLPSSFSSLDASRMARTLARWRAVAGLARRQFSSPVFQYEPLFQSVTPLPYPYRKITSDYVSEIELGGKRLLQVEPEALRLLAAEAMTDIAHLLRPGHLQQLAKILDDPDASSNDRFVALELLKNANVAAGRILPGCQDTGTAIVAGKRGQYVFTDGNDEEHLSRGVFDTYTRTNLRYSQVGQLGPNGRPLLIATPMRPTCWSCGSGV
eukprot:scaffold41911_cov31-Tisochrysis_lutea.AAC.4